MKSVGEAMAIGRTFKESLQKCLRSLEIGRSGLGGDGKCGALAPKFTATATSPLRDVISRKLSVPNAEGFSSSGTRCGPGSRLMKSSSSPKSTVVLCKSNRSLISKRNSLA